MTEDVIFCREDQNSQEAARMMEEQRIERLLVVDDENRPVGVFSINTSGAWPCHPARHVREKSDILPSPYPATCV